LESNYSSSFLFTVCQVGAEGALKEEISKNYPDLRFAFSRPGYLTFKSIQSQGFTPDFHFQTVFARAYGVSLGQFKTESLDPVGEAVEKIRSLSKTGKLRLHVWERDFHAPNEEPEAYVRGALSCPLEKKIRSQIKGIWEESVEAQEGDLVFDVVVLDQDQYGLGIHWHSALHSSLPGGYFQMVLPKEAPSRAFLKLEEVIHWSQAPIRSGDLAIEIGSAPGGASYSLLKRGISVVGIDPAAMDPRVLQHPEFRHIQRPVGTVLREELPESIQWLLLDMNVEPRISMFAVDRLASRMIDSLLGVFLTVKLNQWKFAREIPDMVAHVKAMGMTKVKVAQLSHHRQEIAIYGLTRKGQRRRS
jgi:23S rRNA (cytidine2498-2'-O)-methyltransferase